MSHFKRFALYGFLLSAGLLIGAVGTKANVAKANATAESWSESLYTEDFVKGYGSAVVANADADYATSTSGHYSYFVRHGYLANNKCYKYDNVTANATSASFKSNVKTDSDASHWQFQMNGGKITEGTEDGVILGMTANEKLIYSIDTMTFKGWPNGCRINTYVQKNGTSTYTSVQSVSIANTSTEYSQSDITLNVGDTVYWEFIQLYGGGNIQSIDGAGLPTFNFREYVLGEKTVNTTELARGYYNNALKTDATADYATDDSDAFEYGVRHGKIENNNVVKFDSVGMSGTNLIYSESDDTTETKARITYGKTILSANDDGVIFAIRALKDITFASTPKTFGGWQDNVYLTYAIKDAGKDSYTVVAKEYYHGATNSGETKEVAPILLHTGDEMLFEFRFPYSATASNGRRSIQDNKDEGTVPTFVIRDNNVTDVTVEANTFMVKYMRLATIETSNTGSGACKTQGWYTAAKAAFNSLSSDARELFLTDAAYSDGAARLHAWAIANNDTINSNNTIVSNSLLNRTFEMANGGAFIAVIIIVCSVITSISMFFLFRRKKAIK